MEKISLDDNIWMVRAGKRGRFISEFLEKNVVAISYGDIGDLSRISNIDDIKKLIVKRHSDQSEGTINSWANQIYHFLFDLKKDKDYVITYDNYNRNYHIGKVIGDFEYNKNIINEFRYIRKVKWLYKIPRDDLSPRVKYSLNPGLTIFRLNNDAKNEIIRLLNGDGRKSKKIMKK